MNKLFNDYLFLKFTAIIPAIAPAMPPNMKSFIKTRGENLAARFMIAFGFIYSILFGVLQFFVFSGRKPYL